MMAFVRTIFTFFFLAATLTGCGRQSSKNRSNPGFNAQSCQGSTQSDFATLFEYANSQAGQLANASRDQIYQIQTVCARFLHNGSNPACRPTHPVSSGSFDSDYQKVVRYCKEVDKYVQNLNKTNPYHSGSIDPFDNPSVKELNRYNRVKLTFKKNVRNDDPEFGNKLAQCYVDFDSRDVHEIIRGEKATVINVSVKRYTTYDFMYDITAYLDARTKLISIFCSSHTRSLPLKDLQTALDSIIDVGIQ